jgi:hypothetical protein
MQYGRRTREFEGIKDAANQQARLAGKKEAQSIDKACALFATKMKKQHRDAQDHDQHRERFLAPEITKHAIEEIHIV